MKQHAYHPYLGWTWLPNRNSEPITICRRLRQGERSWFAWTSGGPVDYAMEVVPGDGNLILLPLVLRHCLDWLRNGDLFDRLTTDERLDHQLCEVYYDKHCS